MTEITYQEPKNVVVITLENVLIQPNDTPTEQEDILIPETLEYLKSVRDEYLILITKRNNSSCQNVLSQLKKQKIFFDEILFSVPFIDVQVIKEKKTV